MAMEIIEAGPLATVQDMGRRGFLSEGFQESGACDKYALRVANILCCNQKQTPQDMEKAVLEFTFQGCRIKFTSEEIIALTGANMCPSINGSPIAMYRPVLVHEGDELCMETALTGLRGYLAVYGGVEVPVVMGSRSTNLACKTGGYGGRALRKGDIVETRKRNREEQKQFQEIADDIISHGEKMGISWDEQWLRFPSNRYQILGDSRCILLRAVPGPQDNAFTKQGMKDLVQNRYRLTPDSNRMACRFHGKAIETYHGSDIISDGIVEGSIQIPASGMPIVMMADHQTTGGYAKIGTVISTDIPALAQLRPGQEAAFSFVTAAEAVAVRRKEEKKLKWLEQRIWGNCRKSKTGPTYQVDLPPV